MTAPTETSVAVVSRVPVPSAEEKLDRYLTDKVGVSLAPLIYRNSRGVTVESIVKLALIAISESERLQRCKPITIAKALHKVARLGLIIGETVYLVPFGTDCVAVVGYQGKMQLAIESGMVRLMTAYVVWDTDEFAYEFGLNESCAHRPGVRKPMGSKPVMTHFWVRIILPRGLPPTFWVITYETAYARMKASKNPDINKLSEVPGWYGQKTVINDWLNRQPKNSRLAIAFEGPDDDDVSVQIGASEALPAGEGGYHDDDIGEPGE